MPGNFNPWNCPRYPLGKCGALMLPTSQEHPYCPISDCPVYVKPFNKEQFPKVTRIMTNEVTSQATNFETADVLVHRFVSMVQGKSDYSASIATGLFFLVHGRNVEAGWWSDPKTGERIERDVGGLLMLMVSEIAEIPPQRFAYSEMDDKLPHRLMFEVELADFCIRAFDTLGALCARDAGIALGMMTGYLSPASRSSEVALDGCLMSIVRQVALAMESHRKNLRVQVRDGVGVSGLAYHLARAVSETCCLSMKYGLDIASAIVEKMEYNRHRADHKPENRIKEGGKAY